MIRVELMIFDLDGTLIDSKEDIARAANFARRALGLAPVPLEAVVSAIGSGASTLIARILGPENLERKEEALEAFRSHYREHLLDCTALCPGVKDVLEHYQEKKKAVLTNKDRGLTLQILEGLGIRDYFGCIEGGDDPNGRKPSPAGLAKIARFFTTVPEKGVMIGDSPIDIEAGRAAGMRTCGILDGFTRPEHVREARPDVCVSTLKEIIGCFN